jgi:hypothetical protein
MPIQIPASGFDGLTERARGLLIKSLQSESSLAGTALTGKKLPYGVKDVAKPCSRKNQIEQSKCIPAPAVRSWLTGPYLSGRFLALAGATKSRAALEWLMDGVRATTFGRLILGFSHRAEKGKSEWRRGAAL